MAISLNDNIRIEAPKLLDERSKKPDGSPYTSKSEVLTILTNSRRSIGLVVLINQDYFYFRTGINLESDLQPLTGTIDAVKSITGDLLNLTDPKNPILVYNTSDYDLSSFTNVSSNPFTRKIELDTKVDKIPAWTLTQNNYTTIEKNKLAGIENAAQVNKIEIIKVDGVVQPIVSKTVDIATPALFIGTSDTYDGENGIDGGFDDIRLIGYYNEDFIVEEGVNENINEPFVVIRLKDTLRESLNKSIPYYEDISSTTATLSLISYDSIFAYTGTGNAIWNLPNPSSYIKGTRLTIINTSATDSAFEVTINGNMIINQGTPPPSSVSISDDNGKLYLVNTGSSWRIIDLT